MRPIIEFAGRNRLQNVPVKVVLNFEVYVRTVRRHRAVITPPQRISLPPLSPVYYL
jgi:hypothetical protein